jgi:hypothetical protein
VVSAISWSLRSSASNASESRAIGDQGDDLHAVGGRGVVGVLDGSVDDAGGVEQRGDQPVEVVAVLGFDENSHAGLRARAQELALPHRYTRRQRT